MKGDFTRSTFRPERHYSGVRMQQGRLQLDADWNEQVDISAVWGRTIAVDVIGPCGAPELGGGFAVSCTKDADLRLSAGRLYGGGTLCELGTETTYLNQPDLPHPSAIAPSEGRTDLVYLDVWQRHITAIEDPEIREPALGGPDTATRTKTVWQVRVLPDVEASDCDQPVDGWPPPASDAHLAVTIEGGGQSPGSGEEEAPSLSGGYAFLEHHLYRVEIHDAGPMGAATFKWSRDNGSVAFAVRELVPDGNQTQAVVERLGTSTEPALEEGDWVEVLGDESELALTPGALTRVERVDEGQEIIWLEGDVSAHARESHLKIRRWDQGGAALPVTDGLLELEAGITVRFSGKSFSTGDYWMFPVRPTETAVAWPPMPPGGIRHDYCRLALVRWRRAGEAGWTGAVTDCRPVFAPLTRRPAGACEGCREEIAQLRATLAEQARELQELRIRFG
jgi:hypothetical protein